MASIIPAAAMVENSIPAAFAVHIHPVGPYSAVVDVKVRPEAIGPAGHCDMVRVIEDDGTYRVIHMTHNEVTRGEMRLSGSMTGLLGTVVRELVEGF